MTSALAEAIEDYAETAKLLVRKWRSYGSGLAANLESGYDAERASADLATAVSLTIETSARLVLKMFDAIDILNAGLDERRMAWSEELSTQYKGAKLEVREDFMGFRRTLAADKATFDPLELGPEDSTFKVGVDVTGCRPGVYDGKVRATAPPDKAEDVPVRIKFP